MVSAIRVESLDVPFERPRLSVGLVAYVALIGSHIEVLTHVDDQSCAALELFSTAIDGALIMLIEFLSADFLCVELMVGALR